MRKRRIVPKGRTLKTNDKYLSGAKTGSTKERGVVVIDSNIDNDLAVVPMSHTPGKNRTKLEKYNDGTSYFKHYIETTDNEGKAIRINDKFKANHQNMDVSKADVEYITDTVLNKCKQRQRNQKKYKKFKNKKSPR